MYGSFINKVVIVTGSGSGIGRAIALLFCKHGAKVMLNGRNESKLKKTAAELVSFGYDVSCFAGDITNKEKCDELVFTTLKKFGKINVLITNAGVSMNARFDKMKAELFKEILDSNVYGSVMPVFASLEALKQTGGSIIFISSVAGFYGMPTASAYSAGKMALTAIQQSIKPELNAHNVHVGILYVGFTENDPDKKLISSSGEWRPVPKRPRYLQQSQAQVARAVLMMVKFRLNKKTLSLTGKCLSFVSRLAPWVIGSLAALSQKRKVE